MNNSSVKKEKAAKEPLIHITRRSSMPIWKSMLVRVIAVVIALLISGLFAYILIGKIQNNPAKLINFYRCFVTGSFETAGITWKFFKNVAILLCVSLAVTPCFKMRFWNIGAEGQVLMGTMGAVAAMWYLKDSVPNILLLVIMLITALLCGAIWAGIPGVFKAIWNTNETLFTLMMNYVASCFVSFVLLEWVPTGNALGIVNADTHAGWLPSVVNDYFIIIVVGFLLAGVLYVYMNYSKHGYEIAVVGESENTAKYVGINVKKVIIRTTVLSGLICGLTGFLIAAGLDHSITVNSVGGQGFTAIMVSWLANNNPLTMIGTSAMMIILKMGGEKVSEVFDVPGALPNVIIGIILICVIGCEFFIHYKVHFRNEKKKERKIDPKMEGIK